MARKIATVTIADEGRDKGKVFVITEMSAERLERYSASALLALSRANLDVSPEDLKQGGAALAAKGLRALPSLTFDDLQPLLAEMFECVKIQPDVSKPYVTRELVEDDIEELSTRLKLRMEWWNLHFGFLKAAGPSLLQKLAPAATVQP